MRRAAEWEASGHTPGWQDLFASVTQTRDILVRELVAGKRDRLGAPHDDEKRAMIHALNTVLRLPAAVRQDAEQAMMAISRFEAKQPR